MPPRLVVTRHEASRYPYYDEVPLETEVAVDGILCLTGPKGEHVTTTFRPDLLLVATYHRILADHIIASASCAVNLHPSLLPEYRGAAPCYWVLRNGEPETGVTAHLLTGEVDTGPIVWQKRTKIHRHETQGSLRKRLAQLSGQAAQDVARQVLSRSLVGAPQPSRAEHAAPRVPASERLLDLSSPYHKVDAHFRALQPFPGALLKGEHGQLLPVESIGKATEDLRCLDSDVILRSGKWVLKMSRRGGLSCWYKS